MAVKQTSAGALAQLKSHEGEPVKQYISLDPQNRPDIIYTGHFLIEDGEPCLAVKYEYLNATSAIVIKRNEFLAEWDSDTFNSDSVDVPPELKK